MKHDPTAPLCSVLLFESYKLSFVSFLAAGAVQIQMPSAFNVHHHVSVVLRRFLTAVPDHSVVVRLRYVGTGLSSYSHRGGCSTEGKLRRIVQVVVVKVVVVTAAAATAATGGGSGSGGGGGGRICDVEDTAGDTGTGTV